MYLELLENLEREVLLEIETQRLSVVCDGRKVSSGMGREEAIDEEKVKDFIGLDQTLTLTSMLCDIEGETGIGRFWGLDGASRGDRRRRQRACC